MPKGNPLFDEDFDEMFDDGFGTDEPKALNTAAKPAASPARAIQQQIEALVGSGYDSAGDEDEDADDAAALSDIPPLPRPEGLVREEIDFGVDAPDEAKPAPAPLPAAEPNALADALYRADGGDRVIPAISVQAFVSNPDAVALVETVKRDRRLSRASVEIFSGGIAAAIERYQTEVTPNLLILETVGDAAELLSQIDELAGHCDPNIQVIVIGRANDIYLYRQLMMRGINEYMVPPVQPVQLIRAISNLFADPDAPFVGKSVAVMGVKGGVGASTIAHNLAWCIAEQIGMNTSLVDLDLSFGTTALDFNQDGAQTVLDALTDPERADEAVLQRLLVKTTDKLSLFTAPASVDDTYEFDASAYDLVIEGVRKLSPLVVLDLPVQWNAWTRSTLIGADEVILVCSPDLASLRNGKNIADLLKAQRANDAPPRLVLNMCGMPKRPEIPVKDFAQAMGIEPDIILPFEPHMFGTATNNGQMVVDSQPDSKPSQAIMHLASVLTGRSVEPPKKSFLQKLLGK